MSKRGKLEGNIRQRPDGRWEGRVWTPEGKRKSFYGKSRDEVLDQITQLRLRIKLELPIASADETVRQACEYYLENELPIHEQSLRVYRAAMKTHVYPVIGEVLLGQVKAIEVKKVIHRMKQNGLKASTLKKNLAIFQRFWRWAKKKFNLPQNPFDDQVVPRFRQDPMQFIQPSEIKKFLGLPMPPTIKIAANLAVNTGMRKGEILGLKWTDINWREKSLRVSRSYSHASMRGVPSTTKTKRSEGIILLSDDLCKELLAYREWQEKQKGDYTSQGFVVASRHGTPLYPSYLSLGFNRAIKRHWHAPLRFHDLRHTHATLLASANVHSSVIQERMRWASPAMMSRYVHVTPTMQRKALDQINRLVEEYNE